MIRLWTLGETGLEDPERPESAGLLGQAKSFAFLCYLAIAGPGRFHRRDSLVTLFWPDLDHGHGRAALRQCLRVLRRHLGEDTIVNRGDDEIGLGPGRVWCDAGEFERLCDADDAVGAMALYRGDLLPGLHVARAGNDLLQWLDETRGRLRRRAHELARRLLEQRLRDGLATDALGWARRALELDPFDEPSLRELLRLLQGVGDRAGAVRAYEEFVARLGAELEVRPSVETEVLIAGIRGTGISQAQAAHPITGTRPPGPVDSPGTGDGVRPGALRWTRPLVAAVLLALLILAALRTWPPSATPMALEPNLVAVMPWRVDPTDTALAYLREGMPDLLSATLTGERGLRSADPRTVLQAVRAVEADPRRDVTRAAALRIARGIGAGRVIQGAVIGSAAHLTLVATEFHVTDPDAPLGFRVSGTRDSLPWMVERLTAQLLAEEAGDPGRLPGLLTASLPALRSYLEGRAAFRRGLYGEASHDFGRALDLDSNFTLAALSLAAGGLTVTDGQLMARGRRVAWRDSIRLSERDRALLKARIGMHYPAIPDERERLAAEARAVEAAPESPEAQYWLADSYFHQGRLLALPDWSARALSGFRRAIELDSGFAAPYQHLIELKLALGDTVGIRSLARTYFGLDSIGEYRDFLRWRVAVGLRDSATLAGLRPRFTGMSLESLYRIVGDAQLEGIELADAERAAAALNARTAGTTQRYVAAYAGETLRANEGRPGAALAETPAMTTDSRRPLADRWFRVSDALYGDGDSTAAERAVTELAPLARRPFHAGDVAADTGDVAACAVGLWRVHHRQLGDVGPAIRRLARHSPADPSGFGIWMRACAVILQARLTEEQRSPAAAEARTRLDSLVAAGPSLASPLRLAAALELADLHQRHGDLRSALAALQRRENEYNPRYLSTQLFEEGRLAARLGDRAAARHAWRHYLALRYDPEPSLRARADSVRAELEQLERAERGTPSAAEPRSLDASAGLTASGKRRPGSP